MPRYNLFIRRYGLTINFNTLEELKAEVKSYLSPREISNGVLDRLTTFNENNRKNEFYIENSYQDMYTYDYGE